MQYLFILILTFVSFLAQCQDDLGKYNLSPVEFNHKIKELPDASVIDVRTPEEFSKGHLQNAQNFNWNDEGFLSKISPKDKNKPVLVYCLSGGRSAEAASKMRSLGFKEVYELKGGIMKWKAEELPLEAESKTGGMNMDQFEALLKTPKLVLVDFYAPWCGPCKKMEPYLTEIKNEMKDKVEVIRIDIDANPSLAKNLKVDAIPVLLLYKNQKETWRHSGYIGKKGVVHNINAELGKDK